MSEGSNQLILVAVIGVVGSLGAAVISNWDKIVQHPSQQAQSTQTVPDGAPAQPAKTATPEAPATLAAPHAPPIEVNNATQVWGENTRQFSLAPGQELTLDGRQLYATQATYPASGCAGAAYIPYTWQIRDPYPKGGDLQITSTVIGGGHDQVAMGSMGSASMGPCGQHTFKNNGLDPIRVEVRYATALEKTP